MLSDQHGILPTQEVKMQRVKIILVNIKYIWSYTHALVKPLFCFVVDSSGASKYIDNSGIFSDHCYSVCSMKQPDIKFSENRGKTTFWGLVLQVFTKCVVLIFMQVDKVESM